MLSAGKSVDIHEKCLYKLLILNKNIETFTPYISSEFGNLSNGFGSHELQLSLVHKYPVTPS